MRHILAIDQGTTSTRAIVFDECVRAVGACSVELPQRFPRQGWVEHDPEQIWEGVRGSVKGALAAAGVDGGKLAGIGITNQRETTILWDRATGAPLHNAIVWQCRRTSDICDELKRAGREHLFRSRTGLVLDPYFSGTKIAWLLRNVEGLAKRAAAGDVAFGTVDSFVLWRLTGGKVHATDPSNASRTLLFNILDGRWDAELCGALGVPASLLPEVKPNLGVFGVTRGAGVLPDGIPIAGMAGDQQAALFGQACFGRDEAKCTYGTGAFLLYNTGSTATASRSGLLTSVGWQKEGRTTYVLEGSAFSAGSAVQWVRDSLGAIGKASEIEALAAAADPASEVVFVPALTGLGAPWWDPKVRGAVFGLTRPAGRAEIARAVLEGICLQIVDLVRAMEADTGGRLSVLKVDGGAVENNLLMQLQADLLDARIVRPKVIETTAAGAALMAGLAQEVFRSEEEIARAWSVDRAFEPAMAAPARDALLGRWRRAVEAARAFAAV